MKKRIGFILFLVWGCLSGVAQGRLLSGEYFWGNIDPGNGNGVAFSAQDGAFGDVLEQIIANGQTVPNMSSPIRFNVRVKDYNNVWGPTYKKVIFLTSNLPTAYNVAVTQAEYFFGTTDPGAGSATQLVVFDGNWNEAIEAASVSNATWSLTDGIKLFNIRAKDGAGNWGPLYKKAISVQSPSATPRLCKIQAAEFFFGVTDPGAGNATALLVLDGAWSDAIETAYKEGVSWSLANGLTLFNVRAKDENNNWGPLFKKTISVQDVPSNVRQAHVVAGEFFFGATDPGAGSGTTILAFDGNYSDAIEQAFQGNYAWNLTGTTSFNIRFKDESNLWGPVFKKTVFVDQTPNPRDWKITFAEYFFGIFDPGAGTGNVIVAFDGNLDHGVEVLLRSSLTWDQASGSTLFNIRVKDESNHWGPVFKRTIFFNGSNPTVNLISQGESISRCPDFSVTLDYVGPNGYNVVWENGTEGNTVTFTPTQSGYFSMYAYLGNSYLYDSIYVNIYNLPDALITPAGEILVCASSNVLLTASAGSNYSYQWYQDGSIIPGSTQQTYFPSQVGAYTVMVTDNSTTCQQLSLPTTFYLTAPIFPTGTVSTSCNPNGVELTAPIGTGNTYQWKKNGANISGATNATYLATTAGNYNVVVTNGQCVSTSGTTTVTNTGSTVNASITPTGTVALCDGGSVQLTAASGTGYTYQWKKDGVNIQGATAQTYLATTAGSYTVVVSATGCSLTSAATIVQVGTSVTPTVSITAGTSTICAGTSVTFTAAGVNGGTTPAYQWKVNGVNAGTNSSTFVTNTLANNDVVTVVMTSNASCASPTTATSNAVTMTVNSSVTPSIAIVAASNPICSGGSFALTATPTNGGSAPTYQWKKNGTNISGATSLTYNTTSAVNGDVFTCVMTSNNTCQSTNTSTSNGVTAQVTGSITPTASITSSATSICSGGSVTFTGSITGGGTTPTYQWKKNGTNISGATSINYTASAINNNDVFTLQMTSNAGCVTTSTATSNAITIAVSTSVTPTVSITAGTSTICAGTTVTFTAAGVNGGTTPAYQWKVNGVNAGTNSSTFATNTLANNDVVTVVMTSNASCASPTTATSNAVTMTVNSSVTPSIAIVAASNPICSGGSFALTATPTNGGSAPTYQWKKNGTNISGATSLTYNTTSAVNGDVFTCVMTSNNTCQSTNTSTSNGVTAQVTGSITPTASITSSATSICSGGSVTFTGSITGGGTTPTYQWKKNGTNISGATSINYTASAINNNDVFTLQMTSNAGCVTTSTATSNAITIAVSTSVIPTVSITAGTSTICAGTTVTFTAAGVNGGTTPAYQWKVNGVNVGTNSSTFATNTLANNDVVTVVMTSNAACASPTTATSNAVTMTVNSSVTPSIAIVAASNPICSGGSFALTATPTNGGTSPTYQWKKNGTNISGATSLTYNTTSAVNGDVFTCVMTSNNTCQSTNTSTSNGVTAQVTGSITPTASITSSATSICSGGSVTFTGSITGGGTTPTYQWKKNGTNISGATSINYTASAINNNDVFTLQMTSNAGCVTTSTATSNAITIAVISSVTYYADADNDGYGNSSDSQNACSAPTGFVTNSNDCNDNSAAINPGVQESCGNQIDDNCNGNIDENCTISGCTDVLACNYNPQATTLDNSCVYAEQYYNCDGSCISDVDNDGVCDQLEVLGCTDPTACNFNPSATQLDASCVLPQPEICNGVDDDCNGSIDEGLTFNNYYADLDLDGYGSTLIGSFCQSPGSTSSLITGDCNDASASINPGMSEQCNGVDDNCNTVVDEGASASSVTASTVVTKLYPTCSGTNLMAANLNLGTNTLPTAGDGLDLWYKFTAQRNTLRAGLSAATGDNAIEIYQQVGNCLQLLGSEHEVSVSNQTLFYDDLVVGNEYYVACRSLAGPANASAKICFNHFDGSTCDHVYSVSGTGVYTNVCSSFKAVFKGNASNYIFNVNSATSLGIPIALTPWSYTTPTSSSIITRLGTLLPANFTSNPIVYGLSVGVTYVLQDAAGNNNYITADGTTSCTATLNVEAPVVLRTSDRCPTIKAITSSIATDRQVCGALRYEWEFTQVLPSAQPPITVLGGLNTNVLFLNAVPGMANGKTYNVRVRSIHTTGAVGEWGALYCMKTTGAGMMLANEEPLAAFMLEGNTDLSLFPNPSDGSELVITNAKGWMDEWVQIEVWNAQGQIVFRHAQEVSGQQLDIRLNQDLSSGLYWIKVKKGGSEEVLRWMINR